MALNGYPCAGIAQRRGQRDRAGDGHGAAGSRRRLGIRSRAQPQARDRGPAASALRAAARHAEAERRWGGVHDDRRQDRETSRRGERRADVVCVHGRISAQPADGVKARTAGRAGGAGRAGRAGRTRWLDWTAIRVETRILYPLQKRTEPDSGPWLVEHLPTRPTSHTRLTSPTSPTVTMLYIAIAYE